jgi:putative methyltransferase (TIGR04325 family)
MTDLRKLARAALPPALSRWIGQRLAPGCTWEGDFASWAEAVRASTGYDDAPILERVTEAALAVKRGEAAWERDGVTFDHIAYAWPVLAGLLRVAARHKGRLRVLDFGGGLGTSYVQSRPFLEGLDVRWNIVEQHHFVARGKASFEDDRLRFYGDIDACVATEAPDVLLLSSVLPYVEHPYELLGRAAAFGCVIVDRTPMSPSGADRLTVQTVPPSIYEARYPCWVLSEPQVVGALAKDFSILSTFDSYLGEEVRAGSLVAPSRGLIALRHGGDAV